MHLIHFLDDVNNDDAAEKPQLNKQEEKIIVKNDVPMQYDSNKQPHVRRRISTIIMPTKSTCKVNTHTHSHSH